MGRDRPTQPESKSKALLPEVPTEEPSCVAPPYQSFTVILQPVFMRLNDSILRDQYTLSELRFSMDRVVVSLRKVLVQDHL
jgi:hypothetical protein